MGESWKARARKREGTVQARTVGITTLGVDGVVANKAQAHCPRLEGLAPWFMTSPIVQILITQMRVVLVVFSLVAVAVGFWFLPVREWFMQVEGYVQSLGVIGPAVVTLAYVLCTVLLVPGSAITVGAGGLFGLKTGLLVVIIGANAGALCSFLLARSFLREKVARWTAEKPKFRTLDRAIGREGFKMVLLTRLSPVFPFVLLNYFLGLTAVRIGSYVLANLLGMLPATFLFVYAGAAARDAIAGEVDPSAGLYRQIFKYLGLLATFAVVVAVTRMARKALREAEQLQGM